MIEYWFKSSTSTLRQTCLDITNKGKNIIGMTVIKVSTNGAITEAIEVAIIYT